MRDARVGERKGTEEIVSPFPIHTTLPSIYADDDFVRRFTQALDDVLAPVISAIDCWPAYLDPRTTPVDFLHYIAAWVGVTMEEDWDLALQRRVLVEGAERARWRGASQALRSTLDHVGAERVEVYDSGGVIVSPTPTEPDTWSRDPQGPVVRVELVLGEPTPEVQAAVTRVVRSLVAPQCRVDVVVVE
jgi:phage tail-like protein